MTKIRIITIADPHLGEVNDGTANLTTAANYLKNQNSKFDLVVVLGDYHNLSSAQTILSVIGKPIHFAKGNHDGLTACNTSSFRDNVEIFNGYQLIFVGICGNNPGQPILTKIYDTSLPTIIFIHGPTKPKPGDTNCTTSWGSYYGYACGFVDTLGLTKLLGVYSGHVHQYTNQVITENNINTLYVTEDNLGGNGPATDYIGYTCIKDNGTDYITTYARLDYKTGTTIPDCIDVCQSNWICEQPLDGYEYDINNCGSPRRLAVRCNGEPNMVKTMLTGGDWRDASTTEINTLVSFINSSNVNIFIGLGDYLQTDTPAFRSRITRPAKWVKGNHDGTVDKWTGLYNWNGIQLLSGGYSSSPSILDQLDSTKPSMYFQHVQFVQIAGCGGSHSGEFATALRAALETKPKMIGGACGHNHTYSEFLGTDRVFIQTGTQPNIRYCKTSPGNDWSFGYWEFDNSVSGKLTVRYYKVAVQNTFVKPGTPTYTFTINIGGGVDGGDNNILITTIILVIVVIALIYLITKE